MIPTSDTHSLTDFTQNARTYIQQLKETKSPMAISVDGETELVVQDADAYQALLDEIEHARFTEAVRQGLKESEQGLGQPAEMVYAEIKAEYDL